MSIMRFLSKPFRWAAVFSTLLTGFFAFALLDTFVIPKAMVIVETPAPAATATAAQDGATAEPGDSTEAPASTMRPSGKRQGGGGGARRSSQTAEAQATLPPGSSTPVTGDMSYEDENISITIKTVRAYDTALYVADIVLSDASYLKTAFANNTYGRNIKATTSATAAANNAVFAINGDYYGFRDKGYVLRNGVLYRDSSNEADALVIDENGNFSVVREGGASAQALLDAGATQVFSFGPMLVENGAVVVGADSEVSQSMQSNPRTAIGQISELHYIFIVSDGRTDASSGLSLLELAEQFEKRGCTVAYNLDGGGSSVMYFGGEVVNNPTNGRSIKEREVSDIVYIGY